MVPFDLRIPTLRLDLSTAEFGQQAGWSRLSFSAGAPHNLEPLDPG